MIQRNQKVVVVSGGDATRAIKVQTGSGTDDLSRFPLIYTDGVRGRDQEVQLVTGGDTSRIPKVTLDIDAYIRSLGPALWLRNGIGTAAGQWDDISGNGRHAQLFNSPTLNADGSYTFNGANQYGKTAAFTLNQPTCVLMVVKQVSWTAGDSFFDGNSLNGGSLAQQSASTSPRIQLYAGASGVANNSNLAVGSIGVVSSLFNGGSSILQVNKTAATTGNAGTNNMGGFTIGATGAPSGYSNIQVYETVIFPIAPSTAQLDRLVAGLMARHGVA